MPLPEIVSVRYSEDDAGYVTVRPVVKQTFHVAELADMIVCLTGKDARRVQQIFQAGSIVYNGYHYWWEGFPSEASEIRDLLAPLPDDDPSRPFDAARITSVSLESGGGTQRSLVGITFQEAAAKRLFHKLSPWQILLKVARETAPRYEKYSHAQRADVYRLHLSPETAASLLNQVLEAAPRGLRKRLAALHPPASLLFLTPRAQFSGTESLP